MPTPKNFSWTVPTQNVDGSPIAAGEITGFQIGVRPASSPAVAQNGGTYPINMPVDPATATSDPLSELNPPLTPGNYFCAIQTLSTTNGNSAWTNEFAFTVFPQPEAPSNFAVA